MPAAGSAPVPVTPPAITAAKPEPVDFEFDGGATDITDVAMADFPVLTDAVELPAVAGPIKRPAAAALPAPAVLLAAATPPPPVVRPAPAPRVATPTPTAKPAASRIETAYTAPKGPPPATAPPKPAVAPPPAPAATAKPSAPARTPPPDLGDDDLLRQTQTMRAIAVAKSIDDISSSMAETLFGDAELDLVTAALASAAEWPDDDTEPVPALSKPEPAKAAPPVDDPFDLFGLGDDAPLELIDDSVAPPADSNRKSATR
jgi:hypothetical protein